MNTTFKFLLSSLVLVGSALALDDKEFDTFKNEVPDGGKMWALLVAGSAGYYNYRHQADVCHAYQILHSHGIPDENIVVMMVDDIAYSPENPTPGKIINRPNGTNVYQGVPRDYTQQANNPDNFLSVLKGKAPSVGSGKVIASTEKDHVFVYFADHGGPGLLGFQDEILEAGSLIDTLTEMSQEKRFEKLVFYVEACESGSMFEDLLPENLNIYATTASNSTTSSFACYYDPIYKTYLGDVYSVKWLEDTDREDVSKETFEHQFDIVRQETNTSEVCQFGTLSIANDFLSEFFGSQNTLPKEAAPDSITEQCGADAIPSHMVPVVSLENRIASASTIEEAEKYQRELDDLLALWSDIETTVHDIAQMVDERNLDVILGETPRITQRDCYYAAVRDFHAKCFNMGRNEYATRHVFALANLCQLGHGAGEIQTAIEHVCVAAKLPIIDVV